MTTKSKTAVRIQRLREASEKSRDRIARAHASAERARQKAAGGR